MEGDETMRDYLVSCSFWLPVWLMLCSTVGLSQPKELFRDDFQMGLTRWEFNDSRAVAIKDSGDPEHDNVMQLEPGGARVFALIRGSGSWRGYRIEGEVLFPTNEDNYLGVIYNYRETPRRVDLGSIYIKGNESYIRVNPRRDWNPARQMYEEYRTNLKGNDAIVTGKWQRFAAEVVGNVCHFYVGDLQTPKVTFDLFEGGSGKAGFKPREVGGAVWIDNIHVTAIAQLSYRGPRQPTGINYQPEKLITDWQVLGPLTKALPEIEAAAEPVAIASVRDEGTAQRWHKFATDARGAVVTGKVTEYTGSRTVAYFATTIKVTEGDKAVLQFSMADNLAVWRNGKFVGYFDRDQFAWHDFGNSPKHPKEYASIPLSVGSNNVLVRVRGGQYATGGFFARVLREEKSELNLSLHPSSDRDPAWSPDGKRIAFVSDRDGNFEIYVMKADGTGQARLTTNSAADSNPAWSRDGKQLDGLAIMFRKVSISAKIVPVEEQGGTWDAFFWVDDAEALHAEFKARGAEIAYGPLIQDAYEMKEFAIRDCDGHVLEFDRYSTNGRKRIKTVSKGISRTVTKILMIGRIKMRKLLYMILAFIMSAPMASWAQDADSKNIKNKSPNPAAAVKYLKIAAPSLGAGRLVEVAISKPSGNKPAGALPVVIFLHGWGGNAHTWAELGGPTLLTELISSGQTPPMTVVAPDGSNSNWLNWHNGEERWEDFLTKDLPAALQKHFRVGGFSVIGTSMGGEAALRLALKFPGQFQCAAALSAALHPADPDKLPGWAKQGFGQMPELKKQYGFPLDAEF